MGLVVGQAPNQRTGLLAGSFNAAGLSRIGVQQRHE